MITQHSATIFVDRDGVINQDSDDFIKSLAEWHPIPNSIEALAALSQRFNIIVITNQSGIARGLLTTAELDAMHTELKKQVHAFGGSITDILYCPHGPNDLCTCRKPKPGLLLQAQEKYALNLKNSWCIGDSYRDLEAGLAVGTQAALVRTGKGLRTLAQHPELEKTLRIFDDLNAFSTWILTLDTQKDTSC